MEIDSKKKYWKNSFYLQLQNAFYSHSESSSLRSVFAVDVSGFGGGGIIDDMLSSKLALGTADNGGG